MEGLVLGNPWITQTVIFLTMAVSVTGLLGLSKQLIPAWVDRDFDYRELETQKQWKIFGLAAAFIATTVGLILWTELFTPVEFASEGGRIVSTIPMYVLFAMTILAFVSAHAAFSDSIIFKAPYELQHAAMVMGFPLAVLFAPEGGLVSMLLFALIPSLLFFANGIGLADIRMLWVITFTVSWWAGWYMTFLLLGVSALLQFLLSLTARWTGWGKTLMVRPGVIALSFRKLWKKISPSSKVDVSGSQHPRKVTPWLPAIAFTFVAGLSLLAITGNAYLLYNGGVGYLFT